MAAVHEEMHANTEGKQGDEDAVSGEDVNPVLISQKEAGYAEEDDQDEACARLPKAAGRLRLVS